MTSKEVVIPVLAQPKTGTQNVLGRWVPALPAVGRDDENLSGEFGLQ